VFFGETLFLVQSRCDNGNAEKETRPSQCLVEGNRCFAEFWRSTRKTKHSKTEYPVERKDRDEEKSSPAVHAVEVIDLVHVMELPDEINSNRHGDQSQRVQERMNCFCCVMRARICGVFEHSECLCS